MSQDKDHIRKIAIVNRITATKITCNGPQTTLVPETIMQKHNCEMFSASITKIDIFYTNIHEYYLNLLFCDAYYKYQIHVLIFVLYDKP